MLSSTKDGYRNFVETNMDVLGKQYIDGEWVDAQSEPTQLDRIEEQLKRPLSGERDGREIRGGNYGRGE